MPTRWPRAAWPVALAVLGLVPLLIFRSAELVLAWTAGAAVVALAIYAARRQAAVQALIAASVSVFCLAAAFLGGLYLLPAALALLAIALTGGVAPRAAA